MGDIVEGRAAGEFPPSFTIGTSFDMLAVGARGAIHVRGKDCVHLEIVERS